MKKLLLAVLSAASIVAVPSFARAVECYEWVDYIGGYRYVQRWCCDENGCWRE
jgi:hypothetical protein